MKKLVDYSQTFYHKEVKVSHSNLQHPIELGIQLNDINHTPDCKVGHFGFNFWFRTPYGIKAKKYKSQKKLESAVEKVLKNNNFEILGWV